MAEKARIIWIDYARALAIVLVVLCHATELVYQLNLEGVLARSELSQAFSFFLFTLGRLGVPFFLFMTGYLLLDRKYDADDIKRFYKSKWFGILLATEIWILIYSGYRVIAGHHALDLMWILDNMLFITPFDAVPQLWYIPMILGFYLLLPVMANGLHMLKDSRVLFFPVAIIIFVAFVIPVINTFYFALNIEPVSALLFTGFSGGEYGCYMVLGYFCKKGYFNKIPTLILALMAAIGICATVGEQLFAYHHDYGYNVWYNNVFLLLGALSLFVLLARLPLRENIFVRSMAKYSFAIYLVHMLVLYGVVFLARKLPMTIPSYAFVIILLVAVSILSLAVCILIAKIPKLGKIALYMR